MINQFSIARPVDDGHTLEGVGAPSQLNVANRVVMAAQQGTPLGYD